MLEGLLNERLYYTSPAKAEPAPYIMHTMQLLRGQNLEIVQNTGV